MGQKTKFFSIIIILVVLSTTIISNAKALTPEGHSLVASTWNAQAGVYNSTPEGGTPDTRQNAMLLNLHINAILKGEVSWLNDPAKINSMVNVLTSPPAFLDGPNSPYNPEGSQNHIPGFAFNIRTMENPLQHVAADPMISLALANAYVNRYSIGLNEAIAEKAKYAIIRTADGPAYAPHNVRLGQFNWNADMMWARYLVTGDSSTFITNYRKLLDGQTKIMPKLVGKDGAYRYQMKRKTGAVNKMDTPEYSAISFMGASYIPQARQMGMKITTKELRLYRDWGKRIIWGNFSNSGYPNWDSGMGVRRIHTGQYWGWMLVALERMTNMTPELLLSGTDIDRARGLCAAAKSTYSQMSARTTTGLIPTQLFGSISTFVKDKFPLTANARITLATENCKPPTKQLGTTYSLDKDRQRYAINTNTYSTSITTWAHSSTAGILPNKLFDKNANPIGGIGGIKSSFGFKGTRSKLSGKKPSKSTITGEKRGSGPITAANRKPVAKTNNGEVTIKYHFHETYFTMDLTRKNGGSGYWQIPVPKGAKISKAKSGSKTIITVKPAVGSIWKATVSSSTGNTRTKKVKDRSDKSVDRLVLIQTTSKTSQMKISVG